MKKFCLLILALLAGCAKQPSADDNALIITAFSTDFDTKATETSFEAGDIIGIFLENNASNLRYETADGSSWKGFGNVGEFSSGDNVTAYYPYSETATNQNAIEVSGGVDFMICPATPITVADNKASANLKFKHVLGKLVVSMERPEEINGVKTVSLDSIVAKNVFRKGTIDLADGKISGLADKGDLKAFGTEIIVIPQTVQKTKLVFKMVGGTFDSLSYNTPILLESGKKTILTATSNADLYFTSTLDLKSGEAQTNLPLSFYIAPGRTWTLTSSEPWLTVTPATGVGAATVKVSVKSNSAYPLKPRSAILTLEDDKPSSVLQKTMQNSTRIPTVEIAGTNWTTANLGAANPQDYGNFYKFGSPYVYDRVSGDIPAGHWGGETTGSGSYPDGDPCRSLGAYKTPTKDQWVALVTSGKSSWTTYQGINGYFFGPKAASLTIQDGSIFLPAAGYRHFSNGSLDYESSEGLYWSSSVRDSTYGWFCFFNSGSVVTPDDSYRRSGGFSVRCVEE